MTPNNQNGPNDEIDLVIRASLPTRHSVIVIYACMAGAVGLELTTPGFGNKCSAN